MEKIFIRLYTLFFKAFENISKKNAFFLFTFG